MTMRKIYLMALFAALISGMTYAALPLESSFFGFFTGWLPIILGGIVAAISLVAVYYFIGVIIGSPRIKASALSEMEQLIGNVILIVAVIFVLELVGAGTSLSFQSVLSGGPNPVNNQVHAICNNILPHSQVSFLISNAAGSPPEPTTAVCNIINGHGVDVFTNNIDYGLAATYVVIANLTNQSIEELNSIYNFDSLIFFLRPLTAYVGYCEPWWCAPALAPRVEELTLSYQLYRGYVLHRVVIPSIITQANLSFYLFTMQLVLILLLLVLWPWLLAAGLVLKTFTFTRRVGGLLIAATLVGVLIYPIIFLFQYASLNTLSNGPACTVPTNYPNGGPPCVPPASGVGYTGASQIPPVALCGENINTPTISTYTNGYSAPTQYQLFCYTFAKELSLDTIYISSRPACDTSVVPATGPGCTPHGADIVCLIDGVVPATPGPNDICACPPGNSGFTTTDYQDQVPLCYVQKTLSFYTFPDAASVVRLYSCYAPDYGSLAHTANDPTNTPDGLLDLEVRITNGLNGESPINILESLGQAVVQFTVGAAPPGFSPSSYQPSQVPCGITTGHIYAAIAALINMYGIISVTGFILPVINVLLMISAVVGLSQLLGGETNIIGLSRFI